MGPLPRGAALHAFRPKRVIGAVSWHFRRKYLHLNEVADALMQSVQAAKPDHVAFTGDAVNIASPLEFPPLRAWMDRLGPPDWLSFVPGNHDLYAKVAYDKSLKLFEPFMAGDMRVPEAFPYVRLRRNVALIGLNSALPRPFQSAEGRLGEKQRSSLRQLLIDLKAKGFCRVVMIHHPPGPGLATKLRALQDAAELKTILCEQEVELVIHGHNHRRELHWLEEAGIRVPAIGVPSGSMALHAHQPAEWNLYEIARQSGKWMTRVTINQWKGKDEGFVAQPAFNLEN
ncbi:metallophosphoesterase [Aestuariivirga litoralis]|nr:metallophosphoesterase [Aestuariivirga litoralis]